MKRIVVAGAVAAFAMVGFSSTAQAAPADAACFGQVHKLVNSGFVDGIDNVGQLVRAVGGGQNKNTTAKTFC
mgnify:CR=1 FL=1|jgi:hypothetical protein